MFSVFANQPTVRQSDSNIGLCRLSVFPSPISEGGLDEVRPRLLPRTPFDKARPDGDSRVYIVMPLQDGPY